MESMSLISEVRLAVLTFTIAKTKYCGRFFAAD